MAEAGALDGAAAAVAGDADVGTFAVVFIYPRTLNFIFTPPPLHMG